jgi:hypothetical protein
MIHAKLLRTMRKSSQKPPEQVQGRLFRRLVVI